MKAGNTVSNESDALDEVPQFINGVEYITNDQLLKWAEIIHNGYVKPDANNSKTNDPRRFNPSGVIRETKGYDNIRVEINDELLRRLKRSSVKRIE